MKKISFSHNLSKILNIFVLLCLLLSGFGQTNNFVQAQEGSPETPIPTVPIETPTPAAPLTPLPTIAPTEEALLALDLADAGTGALYRAQIRLKQPMDLTRLQDWNIQVLDQGSDSAVVQVIPLQLSKLARLGFEPTQIDSVDYMLTVFSLTTGDILSLSDVTSSVADMMALASVDTDSDGLTDTEEAWWCTNPNDENSDSPQPSTPTNPNDGTEVNNILRGITAYGPPFALWPQFTPYNQTGNCPDGDFDGAPDYAEEFMIGTSNLRESSDLDKFDDGQELFGVTFCPGSSGPCGYGILPRAEDAAFVSANLPAWVKAPGNNPFVAAFPEPEVEVVPSSLNITQVTVITNTKGTTVGTEKTYGTASTKGTSTSLANTESWNEWQAVYNTKQVTSSSTDSLDRKYEEKMRMAKIENTANFLACPLSGRGGCASSLITLITDPFNIANEKMAELDQITDQLMEETKSIKACTKIENRDLRQLCLAQYGVTLDSANTIADYTENSQDRGGVAGSTFGISPNQELSLEQSIRITYPIITMPPLETVAHGSERGWAQTTTKTEYEEQTISQSSTDQYSDNWSTATAVDSAHAADLRFTYNIVNNGTEYAREVSSLTFNIYIGNNPNPAYTYVAVGPTGQIAKIENLFPGDELTYTSNPIQLTLDEMRAIDEGTSVRVVMENISFGQDQVFYSDALSGSITLAMEDGFDDNDEVVDTYVIPVWDPSDSLQDVVKRYFPVTEDAGGDLLSVYTPESSSAVPVLCEQNIQIAPASYTTVYCKHALNGTSWWNIYLSDGLNYNGVFSETLAQPNASVLVRIVSDRDLDGYNDRNEILLSTDPDDPASHPAPNLIAGYTTTCVVNDCTVRMVFQNLGNYDAYGVESVMYSPDGLATITNNTIGGSGRVAAGNKVVVGPSDTFQYTKTASSVEPVIVVSYNDPQGNHRFVLPSGNYPTGAKITTLDDVITALNGKMLLDPGVDISSTSSNQAGFVINLPHQTSITNGKLFVEYIDGNGTVLHEDVTTQNFDSGPTVVPQTIDLGTYPPETTILLAFFTDSAGNIIDSSARPLASFGADPSPEANITVDNWEIGAQSLVNVPNPWNLGTFEPGTTLHAKLYLTNTGLGDLRYSLTGLGNGWTIAGNSAGTLGPTGQNVFDLSFDSAGISPQTINQPLYLRTNDPANGTVTINLLATIGTPVGTASAYQVGPYQPWDQFVYVPGPHSQNDIVNFTHTLADDPSRMFPLYMYNESGSTLKGVGEYGVDFSGQTAPFGVFGTGADGDLIVTSGQTVYTDNTRSAVSATANSAQPNIVLSSATGLVAGQEVVIIQIQGTGAGVYEFANIASVSSNTLTLTKNLTNAYTVGGNSKAQVIRVMQYHNVTVQSGGVLTAHTWNGSTGGIAIFRATGTISVLLGGLIDLTGKGFRGGIMPDSGWTSSGFAGESYIGPSFQSTSPNGGGGAGGCDYQNAGGSGGSYGEEGINGYGNQCANSHKMGFTYGSPTFGTPSSPTIFLGSGGGSAGGAGADGGNGGGALLFFGRDISIAGVVRSNGANGQNGGESAAAGGSGGSIKAVGQTVQLGATLLIATGGAGGDGTNSDGGNGGSGRIRIEYNTLSGTTNPAASTQQVNYYSITGQGAPFGVFGNGTDGDLTVTSGQTIYTDNVRAALASTATSGQANITVSNATGFAIGKEVLIIQSQGIGVGAYEFAAITNMSGNMLTLSKPLGSTYTTGGNSKAQVLVVPQYHNVTVQSGGVLTANAWDGNSGGIVAFRASGTITVTGTIRANGNLGGTGAGSAGGAGIGFRGGQAKPANGNQQSGQAYTGEGSGGSSVAQTSSNYSGGGGGYTSGYDGGSGGGGSHSSPGGNGMYWNTSLPGIGATLLTGTADLSTMTFGGGGGGASIDGGGGVGAGGGGGGIILITGTSVVVTGSITANGGAGGNADYGGGGGGAGGSILIKAQTATLGTSLIMADAGAGGLGTGGGARNGGNGGVGRIRVEYTTLSGTTNPIASTQQVNYYNLTGSSSNTLYVPDTIGAGNNVRYKLLYGQRSVNTTGGDQLYSVHLANRHYSTATLSALIEQVAGSGSTFNFCLDFGNDGTCDYTANSQAFIGPVRLDSTNLANALNAYITAQASTAPVLTIPIRVNINTPADIFLFNVSATPLTGVDLQPSAPVIAPQNGNPASNIPEGVLVNLSATITNNGASGASNFTTAFYLGDPANGGTLIGSTFVESLASGAISPAQTVVWNTSGLLGEKTIYVKVDPSGAVNESNENNNITSTSAVVKKKPDLTTISLSAPNIRAGEPGSVSVVVKNDGEADVTGAVVRLYLGTDTSGTVLGNVNANVPQGQSTTVQIPFTIGAAGSKSLFVKVDPANVIVEANEQNNSTTGSTKVGWDLLTVDAGGANDTVYSSGTGYGWMTQGAQVTTCGTQVQQSYRQVGSAENLQYRFDNLIPGRRYHLDLTFATCSGERYLDLFVDGAQMAEAQAAALASASISPVHVTNSPQTVSLMLDPASYASDGSILLSISRNSGFGGPLVNIIDLQEVKYCYLNSGPDESPWSANNNCGYDSTWTSDGFNGWGTQPYESMRFGTGSVKYKFSDLAAVKKYNLRMTYYEEDNAARIQRVTFDGASPSSNFTLSSTPTYLVIPIPASSYADAQVVVAIERPAGGESVVSEITLEEDTRSENNRYPAPGGGGQIVTPTATPTGTSQTPQVTLGAFSASWVGSQVKVDWATTTEINNDQFELYRATNASGPWTLASQVVSKHSCGVYTSTTAEAYTYTDASVSAGVTYYYKLHFSGEGCGIGALAYAQTAKAEQPIIISPVVSSIVRANTTPSSAASVNFTVTFSESVTGVNPSDFNLTTSGVSSATVSGVSGSGTDYTVTVNTGTGNGTIRLDIVNDGSIKNATNNPLTAGFTTGEIYTIIKLSTFEDVPLTYWASSYIERLYNAGITGGCSTIPLNYCPDNTVTRAQMAIFLLKGMHGSGYVPPVVGASTGFGDVATDYWAAAWVKQLAAEGITSGCGNGNYCPDATVTRAQMAIFLLKAKYGPGYTPSSATGIFTDVEVGYWADKWIEQLAAEGITGGCGAGIYCPDESVTRAQMAVFLVKAFGLP